jgi:hypothetical protein
MHEPTSDTRYRSGKEPKHRTVRNSLRKQILSGKQKGLPGTPDLCMSWESSERGVSVVALGEAAEWPDRAPRMEWVAGEAFYGALCFSIISGVWLESLLKLGIPIVLVDYPSDRFARRADQVFADPLPGYRAAVRHLAHQGLRRIHFLSSSTRIPPPDPDMSIDEWRAYAKGKWFEDPDNPIRGSEQRGRPE